jgi:hypothetical protein
MVLPRQAAQWLMSRFVPEAHRLCGTPIVSEKLTTARRPTEPRAVQKVHGMEIACLTTAGETGAPGGGNMFKAFATALMLLFAAMAVVLIPERPRHIALESPATRDAVSGFSSRDQTYVEWSGSVALTSARLAVEMPETAMLCLLSIGVLGIAAARRRRA